MTDSERLQAREKALAKQRKKFIKSIILGVTGFIVFLGIWTFAAHFELIDRRLIATPLEVVRALITKTYDVRPDGALLFQHIWSSLLIATSGFGLAVIIGVPLGLLMGWYKPIDRFLGPIFEILRPLPPIAWIPFTIIFLGIGLLAQSTIVFLSAFVASLINSYTGIKLTNPVYINVAKTCGAPNWRIFLRVGIPSALPMVFAGMRISLGNSWSTLVAAEMLAASRGLGYMILMGRTFFRIDLIIGGMIMIGALGLLFTTAFEAMERRILKWRSINK